MLPLPVVVVVVDLLSFYEPESISGLVNQNRQGTGSTGRINPILVHAGRFAVLG
jgi:hypothetical protein